MLSICIPVYNWDVRELVSTVHQQCLKSAIDFEILVLDDCSPKKDFRDLNASLELPNYKFIGLDANVGNAEARNILARSTKNNWLLFLDADMMPAYDNFIELYLNEIQSDEFDIMSGGIIYQDKVADEFKLKWIHGKQTEEQIESKDPYLEIRGNNFLIRKEIFLKNPFGGLPESYGYVDTHFGLKLKMSKARVKIISNPCIHLGLETNEQFVKKYRFSVRNAFWLHHHHPEMADNLRLIQTYKKIKKLGLVTPFAWLFKWTENLMLKNLHSKNPSLFVFQLYKLGYISTLKTE
jgi:glycosyltransferase involved in cell wall biosynthesis